MKSHLLVIDPQNSFCSPEGELYVPGADRDMNRLAAFIRDNDDVINWITVTLDSHNRMNISHPVWWIDEQGRHPEPFTVISADDLRSGRYRTADPRDHAWSIRYLEKTVPHVIWPMHCLTGTWGHRVFKPLNLALLAWADKHTYLDYVFKGSSRFSEHFSAIRASVPVPDDPTTDTNRMLVRTLGQADRIIVAGEASSHCVAHTVRDMVDADPDLAAKIVLLKDCMSPVAGFESLAEDFFHTMSTIGVCICDSMRVMDGGNVDPKEGL
jgi:nicotinamidase-related amidase